MMSTPRDHYPEQLVVAGYLRKVEVLLVNNLMNVIPHDIFKLCCQFYKSMIKLGIAYCTSSDRPNIDSYAIMDICSKQITHYTFIKIPDCLSMQPLTSPALSLLINNITHKLPNYSITEHKINNVPIDGILCRQTERSQYPPKYFPCFLFLGQSKKENKILYALKSTEKIQNFRILLFSEKRNIIYGTLKGNLYELKVSDIIDNHFQFIQLNDRYIHKINNGKKFVKGEFLKMEYIERNDEILIIIIVL